MSNRNLQTVVLRYGRNLQFEGEIAEERILAFQPALEALDNVQVSLADALNEPLDFPPLNRSVFPGDRVILALDRDFSDSPQLIAGIWTEFERAGIDPQDVTILQPADRFAEGPVDPRSLLPATVRSAIGWKIHAFEEGRCGYLASSASGERLYLARELLDADAIITVGRIAFDPVLGYRGTNSVFYPGLSDEDAARKSGGLGHRELDPDNDRPLRMLADEIGWLLGTQFSVQILPAFGGRASHVIAGLAESVMRSGRRILSAECLMRLPTRCEIVIATIGGSTTWHDFGMALETAQKAVVRNGRIVVLCDLDDEPGHGMQTVRDSREAVDALKPLQSFAAADFLPASQLAHAADWAEIYLHSQLPEELAEDLFMTPLANDAELSRLLEGDQTCALIEDAHYAACQIGH